RRVRRRSASRYPNSRPSRMSRSANEMASMGRPGCPFGSLLLAAMVLWSWPSLGQQIGPDDPLPPGAHGEVYPLKADVFALKPEVLDLKPQILELRGLGSAMKARVEDLQGALKGLGAKVTGREIKISLAADVLFDFDKADLRAEAAPALEKVVAVLHAYPKAAALIEGNTGGEGNDQHNQKLSEPRAD